MAQDFLAALEAEIAELESELSADVRFIRLNQLRKTLALYVDPSAVTAEMRALSARPITSGQIQARTISSGSAQGSSIKSSKISSTAIKIAAAHLGGRRASAEKVHALDAVALHLSNRSGPVPTRDLLDHLNDLGIEVGGASPLNNLSAMLSNSDRFVSHGRSGWTLQKEKLNGALELEAMDKVASDFAESLTDEGLLQLKMQLQNANTLPNDVISQLKDAYLDLLGKEYVADGRNSFRKAVEYHLELQISDRAASIQS